MRHLVENLQKIYFQRRMNNTGLFASNTVPIQYWVPGITYNTIPIPMKYQTETPDSCKTNVNKINKCKYTAFYFYFVELFSVIALL